MYIDVWEDGQNDRKEFLNAVIIWKFFYLQIKEINPERILYDSCKDPRQSYILSSENKVMIYFVSDQDGEGKLLISGKVLKQDNFINLLPTNVIPEKY